jgi:lipopolysaccharide/colanic/teichoic acid biosynthesis glycosyltransferase
MSELLCEEEEAVLPRLRRGAILAYYFAATLCGLYGALLLHERGHLTQDLWEEARLAAPLLLLIRLGMVVMGRFQRWALRAVGLLDAARLALAMLVASLLFALGWRTLPAAVYGFEFCLTTAFMLAFWFVPGATARLLRLSRLPRAKAEFVTCEFGRRVLNVIVALVGLVLSSPIWLIISIAIKLTSRGPIFYVQERVGLDLRRDRALPPDPRRKRDLGGRPFMMYKFRTMRVGAERATGAVWSGENDPRVTAVGRFLRHCRLDELPQLINVLKGDMNIVGPRPERPSIFADLRGKIPNYTLRQRARPGITGFAQVNLEYDASIDDVANKLKYDLAYLTQQSITADLYIMAKTVPVMLFRKWVLAPKRPAAVRPAAQRAVRALSGGDLERQAAAGGSDRAAALSEGTLQ